MRVGNASYMLDQGFQVNSLSLCLQGDLQASCASRSSRQNASKDTQGAVQENGTSKVQF